jgi:hypothetical protein
MVAIDEAFGLAFDAKAFKSREEVARWADQIQALHPDLSSWDPAGRGALAQPSHWLLDLVQLAGLARMQESDDGCARHGARSQSKFYVSMALELARRAPPTELLRIDGKIRLPNAEEASLRSGECEFAVGSGNIFDILFDRFVMSHRRPHSVDQLSQLTLCALEKVVLTPRQGSDALRKLLRSNGDLSEGRAFDCYLRFEMTALVRRVMESTPGFDERLMNLTDQESQSFKKVHPKLAELVATWASKEEAKALDQASAPARSSKRALRV